MINRRFAALATTAGIVALSSLSTRADVRADEKTHFQFAGTFGNS